MTLVAPGFFFEPHVGLPLVSIVVSVRTGVAHEGAAQEGLSRLTARLVRRGTQTRSRAAFEEALENLGSELGVDVGAGSTTFAVQVLSKHVAAMADLLAEMFREPALDEAEFDRLKREATAELQEARDSDRHLAQIALRRALFGAHTYGRSASGRLSTVAHLTVADIRAFHAERYVRDAAVIGISGEIDEVAARAIADNLSSALAPKTGAPLDITPPQPPRGRRLVFVDKPDRSQSQLAIASLGTWAHDPDHTALSAAIAVLGGTFTSRLMKEVRSKRGWSYSTSARAAVAEQRHAFTMWSFPAAKDTAPCLSLELGLLESFVKDGITARELSFIKKYLVRSYAFDIDTAHKRLGQRLDVALLNLPADYYSGYRDRVEALDLDAVNAAIAQRLTPADLVIVVVGTASDLADDVAKQIPNLESTEVVPFDRD